MPGPTNRVRPDLRSFPQSESRRKRKTVRPSNPVCPSVGAGFATRLGLALALSALLAAPAAAGRAPAPEPDVHRTELVIRPDITARRLSVEATLQIANPGERNNFTFLL